MCFPLIDIISLLIWAVIIGAVLACLKALLGFVLPRIGIGGEVVALLTRIFMIILYAFITIVCIVIVGEAIVCLIGMAPKFGKF